jgi:hypothetical protein
MKRKSPKSMSLPPENLDLVEIAIHFSPSRFGALLGAFCADAISPRWGTFTGRALGLPARVYAVAEPLPNKKPKTPEEKRIRSSSKMLGSR